MRAREHLGWQSGHVASDAWPAGNAAPATVARLHAGGASLALTAPCDQLFTATEVNEWALCSALRERDPMHWASLEDALVAAAVEAADGAAVLDPPVLEEALAFARLRRLADLEARPALLQLIEAADARDLPYVLDEAMLTLGAGVGGMDYPIDRLPKVVDVPWSVLRDIPTAVVTGSNGKTTTVRLVAACARRQGLRDWVQLHRRRGGRQRVDCKWRLLRSRGDAPRPSRPACRGSGSRDRTRRDPAARRRNPSCARGRRHKRQLRSFR